LNVGQKWKALAALLVVALALTSVADAALTENYQYKRTAQDDAKAGAIVFQRSDLPPALKSLKGGRIKPDETPTTSNDRCNGYLPKQSDLVVTGDAASRYADGAGTGEIDTQVSLFKTAAMAAADWNRQWPTMNASCIREAMANGLKSGESVGSVTRLPSLRCSYQNASFMFEETYSSPGKPTLKYVFFVTELRLGRAEAVVFTLLREMRPNAKTVALNVQGGVLKAMQSRLSST
jgi:hypothetical protein